MEKSSADLRGEIPGLSVLRHSLEALGAQSVCLNPRDRNSACEIGRYRVTISTCNGGGPFYANCSSGHAAGAKTDDYSTRVPSWL